jgi:hypothetical protein
MKGKQGRKGKERKIKERKGKERKGKERKGKERGGKGRKDAGKKESSGIITHQRQFRFMFNHYKRMNDFFQ